MKRIFRWLVAGCLIAIAPKCLVCIATYVAIISGIGLGTPRLPMKDKKGITLCGGVKGTFSYFYEDERSTPVGQGANDYEIRTSSDNDRRSLN